MDNAHGATQGTYTYWGRAHMLKMIVMGLDQVDHAEWIPQDVSTGMRSTLDPGSNFWK